MWGEGTNQRLRNSAADPLIQERITVEFSCVGPLFVPYGIEPSPLFRVRNLVMGTWQQSSWGVDAPAQGCMASFAASHPPTTPSVDHPVEVFPPDRFCRKGEREDPSRSWVGILVPMALDSAWPNHVGPT